MTRFLRIAALILAGEMIFGLPFHTQRFFRATMLEAFEINNTQLGDMFAVYGVTAMFSYFFGGPFADRFSARSLMAVSLVLTALGGVYMATFPGVAQMSILYGYWGVTTIFLFWAALIKATRDWGGSTSQGTAFGVLEGGRGHGRRNARRGRCGYSCHVPAGRSYTRLPTSTAVPHCAASFSITH